MPKFMKALFQALKDDKEFVNALVNIVNASTETMTDTMAGMEDQLGDMSMEVEKITAAKVEELFDDIIEAEDKEFEGMDTKITIYSIKKDLVGFEIDVPEMAMRMLTKDKTTILEISKFDEEFKKTSEFEEIVRFVENGDTTTITATIEEEGTKVVLAFDVTVKEDTKYTMTLPKTEDIYTEDELSQLSQNLSTMDEEAILTMFAETPGFQEFTQSNIYQLLMLSAGSGMMEDMGLGNILGGFTQNEPVTPETPEVEVTPEEEVVPEVNTPVVDTPVVENPVVNTPVVETPEVQDNTVNSTATKSE